MHARPKPAGITNVVDRRGREHLPMSRRRGQCIAMRKKQQPPPNPLSSLHAQASLWNALQEPTESKSREDPHFHDATAHSLTCIAPLAQD